MTATAAAELRVIRCGALATLGMEILGIVVAWQTYEEPLNEGEL
jgi:hypothetical protein